MIFREVTLDDGRVFIYHSLDQPVTDFENKKVYVVTKSYQVEQAQTFESLRAVVRFDEWDPALLEDMELIISTAELKLYTGPEKDVIPPTLDDLKVAKIAYLNDEYNKANLGTFKYQDINFNADAVAQNNINATANFINMFGTFPDDWLGFWIAADGSSIPMPDPADFQPFYKAYVAQGVYNIARFNTLKAQVEAAETASDLDAITW